MGLINEPKTRHFQRAAMREATEKTMSASKPVEPATNDAVDVLNELATRARRLADDIDAAADMIGEQQASNEEALKKLSQLQSILKSLA